MLVIHMKWHAYLHSNAYTHIYYAKTHMCYLIMNILWTFIAHKRTLPHDFSWWTFKRQLFVIATFYVTDRFHRSSNHHTNTTAHDFRTCEQSKNSLCHPTDPKWKIIDIKEIYMMNKNTPSPKRSCVWFLFKTSKSNDNQQTNETANRQPKRPSSPNHRHTKTLLMHRSLQNDDGRMCGICWTFSISSHRHQSFIYPRPTRVWIRNRANPKKTKKTTVTHKSTMEDNVHLVWPGLCDAVYYSILTTIRWWWILPARNCICIRYEGMLYIIYYTIIYSMLSMTINCNCDIAAVCLPQMLRSLWFECAGAPHHNRSGYFSSANARRRRARFIHDVVFRVCTLSGCSLVRSKWKILQCVWLCVYYTVYNALPVFPLGQFP